MGVAFGEAMVSVAAVRIKRESCMVDVASK